MFKRIILIPILGIMTFSMISAEENIGDFKDPGKWKKIDGASFELQSDPEAGSIIKLNAPVTVRCSIDNKFESKLIWNEKYEGVSFKVKGDGSDEYGIVSLGGNWPWGYRFAFPLKNTSWHTVTVPWKDFVAERGIYGNITDPGALMPADLTAIGFGDRWTIREKNKKINPFTYSVADFKLVEKVAAEKKSGKILAPKRTLKEIVQLIKKGESVSILCVGDSVTAGTSVENPEENSYPSQLQAMLRKETGNSKITVSNCGVGGAAGSELRTWIERDFQSKAPDLLLLMYGGNDKSSAVSPDTYKWSLADYIDRVDRKTDGRTAVLLLAVIPWRDGSLHDLSDYAEKVRELALEKKLPCCDLAGKFKTLDKKDLPALYADLAHPNAKGQNLIAKTIADFILKNN